MTTPVVPVAGSESQLEAIVQRIFNAPNYRKEIEKTVKRNLKLIAANEELKKENDTLKAAKPADGGKTLTKDEAAAYDAFVALKLAPADLKKVVEEHATLKQKDTERAEEARFTEAAETLGFENVPALTRWLNREKLELDFKDTRVEDEETGKKITIKMPVVRLKGDDKAAFEPLDEYIEREVPEFVSVFRTAPASGDDADEDDDTTTGGNDTDDVDLEKVQADAAARIRGGKGGISIPATRAADRRTGGTNDKKKLQKMEQEARGSDLYSM